MSMIERQLVSTLATHPEVLPQLSLDAGDFQDFRAGVIYQKVYDMVREGRDIDPVLVAEMLGDDWLEDVVDVLSHAGSPRNVDLVQERIKTETKNRELKKLALRFAEDLDIGSLMADVTKLEDAGAVIQSSAQVMSQLNADIDAKRRGEKSQALTTGFFDLDDLGGGLVPGDSIVVAARTSVGKTAFMCNLAVNCDVPAGIISGEQTNMAIMRRITAKVGGLSMQRLKTGKMTGDEYSRYCKASEKLSNSPIHIVDKSRPSISEIEQYARSMKWKSDIQVLFVDYLQLITNLLFPNDRRLQIADISARLKKLAKDLNIPVVTLAQLNRGAVEHTPRISDLKESGSIEEDADQVMLLYREEGRGEYEVTCDVQKNREGATGKTHLIWKPHLMTFEGQNDGYEF